MKSKCQASKKESALYKCELCGAVSSKQEECCGKLMKKQ